MPGISTPIQLWKRSKGSVSAGATDTVILSRPFSKYLGQKLILNIFSTSENVSAMREIAVSRIGSSDVKHNVSSRLGDQVDFSVNLVKTATDVEVRISNGEAFDLSWVLHRLDITDPN